MENTDMWTKLSMRQQYNRTAKFYILINIYVIYVYILINFMCNLVKTPMPP